MEFYKIFIVVLFIIGVIFVMALIDYVLTNRKSPFALPGNKTKFMEKLRKGIVG